MEINFYITKEGFENLDAVEYEAFERAMDGEMRLYRLRPAMARFMVDEHNKPIPHSQALKVTEKLKLKEINGFLKGFFDVMQDTLVPKANGNGSKLPSEAQSADSLFPAGSQT